MSKKVLRVARGLIIVALLYALVCAVLSLIVVGTAEEPELSVFVSYWGYLLLKLYYWFFGLVALAALVGVVPRERWSTENYEFRSAEPILGLNERGDPTRNGFDVVGNPLGLSQRDDT